MSELTTSHSVPWPVLHKVSAQPSALCPQLREEGPQIFAELGTDSPGGWSADRPKALLDRVLHVPGLGLGTCPVLDGGTCVRVRKANSQNLWTYPYILLAAIMSRAGLQVSTEMQVGKWKRLTLGD